jgi:predicted transcriptional regulator
MTDEQRRQHCDKHEEMEDVVNRYRGIMAWLERLRDGNGQPGIEVRLTQLANRQSAQIEQSAETKREMQQLAARVESIAAEHAQLKDDQMDMQGQMGQFISNMEKRQERRWDKMTFYVVAALAALEVMASVWGLF